MPIIKEIKSKIDSLFDQLSQVNNSIKDFALEQDLEGSVRYMDLIEMRGNLQLRIAELEDKIKNLVEAKKQSVLGLIQHGCKVKLKEARREYDIRIIDEPVSYSQERIVSTSSPLGVALIGKAVGDVVEVNTVSGSKRVEVLDVFY